MLVVALKLPATFVSNFSSEVELSSRSNFVVNLGLDQIREVAPWRHGHKSRKSRESSCVGCLPYLWVEGCIRFNLSTGPTSRTYSLLVYHPNTLVFDCTWRTKRLRAKDNQEFLQRPHNTRAMFDFCMRAIDQAYVQQDENMGYLLRADLPSRLQLHTPPHGRLGEIAHRTEPAHAHRCE